MQNLRKPTHNQKPVLVMLFATPFALIAGTAGYAQPHQFSSTGNSVYIPAEFKTSNDLFSDRLNMVLSDYGLDKQQLVKFLSISRPTLDTWLGQRVENIQTNNQERLELLERLLNENISAGLKSGLGAFCKRRLDNDSEELYVILSSKELDEVTAKKYLRIANRRLLGLKKAQELDLLLGEDRPTFI